MKHVAEIDYFKRQEKIALMWAEYSLKKKWSIEMNKSIGYPYTVVILINATKQFWYASQNPKWRSKK